MKFLSHAIIHRSYFWTSYMADTTKSRSPVFRGASLFFFTCCLVLTGMAGATEPVTIDAILQQQDEPEGVVIEIVTGKDDGLDWALPRAQEYARKLHARFPDMPVAVVSHGREQFALTRDKQKAKPKVHSLTQALAKEGVKLHVCGTYAGWKGLADEDFPDYVDVAAAGPAQINDYKALGFLHVIIKKK